MRWYLQETILPPSDAPAEGDEAKAASFGTATAVPHLPISIRTRSGHVTICVLGDFLRRAPD